jgi:hypothetical protein
MLANSAAVINVSGPGRRGKSRLRVLSRLDGRSAAAKKARKLVELWRAELGTVTPLQEMLLTSAACAVVIHEDAQSRALNGDPTISVAELTKLANIASRAIKQIGLPVAGSPSRQTALKRLKVLG